jgi:hypothetical protein
MDTPTLTGIVVLAGTGLIGAMWALLKAMVSNRLDRIETKQDDLVKTVHGLDNRLTRLETQHEERTCKFERVV